MTTEEQLEKVLHKVQQLDPPGVGARDLRECLLLQLERHSDTESNRLASRIIEKYFDDFTKKHYQKLMDRLDIDRDQLREAIEEITHLNPKPGNSSSSTSRSIQEIIPDFTITVEDGPSP
jgi:RNA polymerase sigma-54 factor